MILIGIDPHKSSYTAVAVDASGQQLAKRRFTVNAGTFRQLMAWCEQWPERRFAVEGAGGLGRSLAQQLAAADEDVVDVPATLSARARMLATGGNRKTDAADARHVAQVALFRPDLRQVTAEDQTTILRLLTERRDDLVHERTRVPQPPPRRPARPAARRRGHRPDRRQGRHRDEGRPPRHRHRQLPPGHSP
ncbi:transposase [Streptomyces sp. NPDC057909]|uniref:IS110 family transposase n=1 Tax=Streptomyces sp. NPDC057909 TaxID=3346277 RepID=UPI0036EDB17F